MCVCECARECALSTTTSGFSCARVCVRLVFRGCEAGMRYLRGFVYEHERERAHERGRAHVITPCTSFVLGFRFSWLLFALR